MIAYYTLPIAIACLSLAIFYSFKASKSRSHTESLKWRTKAMFSGLATVFFGIGGSLANVLMGA